MSNAFNMHDVLSILVSIKSSKKYRYYGSTCIFKDGAEDSKSGDEESMKSIKRDGRF